MTPAQLIAVIMNTCETLYHLQLVSQYNSVKSVRADGCNIVSWPTLESGACYTNYFGSFEQYHQWVSENEYTCLLFDYSIIRALYTIENNSIVGHSLLYWPCPIKALEILSNVEELCEAILLYLESPKRASELFQVTLRSPMRFDFSPGDASEDHPEVHLHTQFEDTRIHVSSPLNFNTFIKVVLRTFYAPIWKKNSQLHTLHEQQIEPSQRDFSIAKHNMQLAWS